MSIGTIIDLARVRSADGWLQALIEGAFYAVPRTARLRRMAVRHSPDAPAPKGDLWTEDHVLEGLCRLSG